MLLPAWQATRTPCSRRSFPANCRTRRSLCQDGTAGKQARNKLAEDDAALSEEDVTGDRAARKVHEGEAALGIAISSQGRTLGDEVDPRFGRAAMFLFVDTDTGAFEAVDNMQNLNAEQGAGIQAAALCADRSADVGITGHCGPKAFRTLSAAGIEVVVGVEGKVTKALQEFSAGELSRAESADVEGHWA